MKKYSILLIFVSLLLACSDDKSDMPKLELIGAFLNGGDVDYSHNLDDILPLSPGDELDVSFFLDGNGTDLKTFIVKSKSDNVKPLLFIDPEEIADEFTDLKEGTLGYKDGIMETRIPVKLKVQIGKEEEVRVSFYLNSKAPDCEGASYYLDLSTTTSLREEPINEE